MTKVVVLGAGIIGSCVAFRLAQAGADVSVVEAGRPGSGVSGTSYAWTNANNKPPRPYHDLNANGMKAHGRLREELGRSDWWHGGGSIEWDTEAIASNGSGTAWRCSIPGTIPRSSSRKRDLAELEPDLDLDQGRRRADRLLSRTRAISTRSRSPTHC